jgi:hypothetical protein
MRVARVQPFFTTSARFRQRTPTSDYWGAMRKLLGWVGAILGSSIGWWAGARVGTMTAVLVSAMGTGAGLYLGWWAAERLLD